MSLDGGAPVRYDLGDVDFGQDATVAKDGTIAFVGRLVDRPGEYYIMHRNAKPVALTDENAWLRTFAIARSERIDWTSDGMAVNGVLTYPANYAAGKQYPMVLVIHGGPVATSTRSFSSLPQMLAAHGYRGCSRIIAAATTRATRSCKRSSVPSRADPGATTSRASRR